MVLVFTEKVMQLVDMVVGLEMHQQVVVQMLLLDRRT
jgi:hypothetical protein